MVVRFGLSYNTAFHGMDPDRLVATARQAEICGFESFYLPEHIALYPDAKIGTVAIPPQSPIADPLQALGFVAAATERIVLGTAVLLIAYHHPAVLAKRLATIDALSKGRMRLLTVGVGAMPGEATAVGVDYRTRGHRADEVIDAVRLLWAGDENGVTFEGRFVTFTSATSYPKPHGTNTLPIHVGGSSDAAARRAGLRGDGYFPGGILGPAERARQWRLARETAAESGRDPDGLEYTRWGSMEMSSDRAARLESEGVNRIVVGASAENLDRQLADLDAFAGRMGMRG